MSTALPRIVGAKLPLRPMHLSSIPSRLHIERRVRDLALFDIAFDSKLRGCDVVAFRLAEVLRLERYATVPGSFSEKPVARFNSKFRSWRGAHNQIG